MRSFFLLLLLFWLGCQKSASPPQRKEPRILKNQITSSEERYPGWLGIRVKRLQQKEKVLLVVQRVVPLSPADRAGIQVGDRILALNNTPIQSGASFFAALKAAGAGNSVVIHLERKGRIFTTRVVLGTPQKKVVLSSLKQAVLWMAKQQLPDGSFPHFATKEKTPSAPATALVLSAFASLPKELRSHPKVQEVMEKGIPFLLKQKTKQGLLGDTQDAVPLESYTTALALQVLSLWDRERYKKEIQLLQKALLEAQLDEKEDYSVYDYQYGGWNYWSGIRRNMMRTDISVASFVLEALYLSGVDPKHPSFQKARHFLFQCQNYEKGSSYADGGFRFSPVESKAGILHEEGEKIYFRSYGSVTADGLRALFYTHLPKNHPRLQAALKWLQSHFELRRNPGFPSDDPARFSRGILFYYYASLAKALALTGQSYFPTTWGKRFWALELAGWLLPLQRREGFWKNSVEVMHEDQPILATSFAILALNYSFPYLK